MRQGAGLNIPPQHHSQLARQRHQHHASHALTLADFALAAHLSVLDYLGDIDWPKAGETRDWYSRIKSRPAFRTLLNDRVVAMPPQKGYADLDF